MGKRQVFFVFLLFICSRMTFAQLELTSELPIIVINTNGNVIVNDPKIMADFGIIYNGTGQLNDLSDPWNEYNGFCGIELRGESSLNFDKKGYGIETWDNAGNDVDASFLNFPEEEDFVLHGPYSDKTLLNNVLAMYIARRMGQYASRTRLVELVINNDYKGVYVLMERIKVEDTRLDIAKLNPDEISGDDLTGGYVIRIDKGAVNGFRSPYNAYGSDRPPFYQFFIPNAEDLTREQADYIKEYVTSFEHAMAASNFKYNGKHYTEYMDLGTFVDNFIINELSKNVDAYRLSTYFHKDKDSKGGKLKAGPIWDYNLAFGNGDYCGGDVTTGYEYYQCVGNSPFWWDRMLQDTLFTNFISCRWSSLRESFLHPDSIDHFIDSTVATMPDAIDRNYQRWNTLGRYLWPNPPYFANARTHGEVISAMKNWIRSRGNYLDGRFARQVNDCGYYENFTEIRDDDPIVTGFDEPLPGYSIYPNPSSGVFNINCETLIRSVRVFDIQGRVIFLQPRINAKKARLEMNPACGSYLVIITTDGGTIREKVIVK